MVHFQVQKAMEKSTKKKIGESILSELPAKEVCCPQQIALLEQASYHGASSKHIGQTDSGHNYD